MANDDQNDGMKDKADLQSNLTDQSNEEVQRTLADSDKQEDSAS